MKKFIIFAVAFTAAQTFASDGKLCVYNYHTGEVKEGRSSEMDHIFRSRSDDKEIKIDVELLKLLDIIQDNFKADCIELISGYRSPELNKKLKKEGNSVAEESQHILGKAADIHIDEVTEEAVAEYVRSLKAGGVGYYPAEDFVHIDVGDVRRWSLPDKPGRLLMAFRKSGKWQVLTDKDIYFWDEPVKFEVMNITRTGKTFDDKVKLQLFRRGSWKEVRDIIECDAKELGAGKTCSAEIKWGEKDQFGKYRFVIKGSLEAWSNEFYRKHE